MGLLDYLQQDPNKQEALRQGLLNAGIAMMGSQSPNFLGSAAQGASSGMQAYTKQFEEQKRKIAQQQAMQAATKPSTPAVYGVGGNVGNADFAQMAAGQNRDINALSALPRMDKPYSIPQGNGVSTLPLKGVPAPVPQPIEQPVDEAALQMAVNQEQGAPEMPADVLPEQIQQIQPAQAGGFDVNSYINAVIGNPDAPKEDRDFALKYMLLRGKGEDQTSEMKNWQFAQNLPEDQRAMFMQKSSGTSPSSVQEWQFFSQLSPEQQRQFLEMKRNPQIMNLGGTQAVRAPGGGIGESYAVTPKPDEMPSFKAAQASAVETAKAGVDRAADAGKKARGADSLISNITEAETILQNGKATGSLLGTGLAAVKSGVGYSDESTQANKKLKLISGWMVSNVPRMEGPQSNYDVENYRQMAAAVGDTTVPINDRLAALKQLRTLQEKYKAINSQKPEKTPGKDGVLSPREILETELSDAEAKGDTRNAGHIREELRRMGVKATAKDLPKKPGTLPAGWTVKER